MRSCTASKALFQSCRISVRIRLRIARSLTLCSSKYLVNWLFRKLSMQEWRWSISCTLAMLKGADRRSALVKDNKRCPSTGLCASQTAACSENKTRLKCLRRRGVALSRAVANKTVVYCGRCFPTNQTKQGLLQRKRAAYRILVSYDIPAFNPRITFYVGVSNLSV